MGVMNMAVFRVERTRDYTVMSNYHLKDTGPVSYTHLEKIKSGDSSRLEGNKISSSIEDLTIIMQRSPKVISGIKKWSPDTVLVGFKLLSHVPHEELIQVGQALLQKNDW